MNIHKPDSMAPSSSAATGETKAIADLLQAGKYAEAFQTLRRQSHPDQDFITQRRHARLLSRMPVDALGLAPMRIAILATSTVDHLATVLKLWLAFEGYDADIYLAPYRQVEQSILDPASHLYTFKPEIVWILSNWRDLDLAVQFGAAQAEVESVVASAVGGTIGMWDALVGNLDCQIIQNNADIPATDIFGNFEGSVPWGGRSLMRRYNLELAGASRTGVAIFDLEHISSLFGKARWVDARYWYHSKHAFNLDASGLVSFWFSRQIAAIKGKAKKCLVLDLDNTLWGGVIGDDGLDGIKLGNTAAGEAFTDFQDYIRQLRDRGIVLAVCSKNDERNAREPFERHPDMRLKPSDIAVFQANWLNKADNIRTIAETLNLGLDSLVFIDDNPVERDLVRQFLPMVAVPEMPGDPSNYIAALHREMYFEVASFSDEDRQRADYYQANALRKELKGQFENLDDFQKSLCMRSWSGSISSFHLPRAAQLINKSNQFHLTGNRYSEAELSHMMSNLSCYSRCFTLTDRFGDNGLISVVLLLEKEGRLEIDTWVMSCRVLGRGMEEFVVNDLLLLARHLGCQEIIGRYVPSKKNSIVAELYVRLGFAKIAEKDGVTTWRKSSLSQNLPTHIDAFPPETDAA